MQIIKAIADETTDPDQRNISFFLFQFNIFNLQNIISIQMQIKKSQNIIFSRNY